MFPEGRILDFLIVGVVALIVVGPKDLPILMRKVGRFVAHMRGMAAEFRASFDEMARQSELDELRREVEAMRSGQTLRTAAGFGADDEAAKVLGDIGADLKAGAGDLHTPLLPTVLPVAAPQSPEPVEASPEAPPAPVAH